VSRCGQWITPKAHVTWCRVVTRVWRLPSAGGALCQCVSESLQIEADCCRSNSWCFKGSLQNSSNRSLRINLLLHVLSKSLQIQAVHCRSVIITSTSLLQIFVVSSWLLQINLTVWERIKLPALLSRQKFQTFLVSTGVRWVFFHWSGFSVAEPVGSCLKGWFPLERLPWIPPCLGLKC